MTVFSFAWGDDKDVCQTHARCVHYEMRYKKTEGHLHQEIEAARLAEIEAARLARTAFRWLKERGTVLPGYAPFSHLKYATNMLMELELGGWRIAEITATPTSPAASHFFGGYETDKSTPEHLCGDRLIAAIILASLEKTNPDVFISARGDREDLEFARQIVRMVPFRMKKTPKIT